MDVLDGRTLEKLAELRGPRMIRGLVDIFTQTVPAKLEEAGAAFASSDATELERAAHSIAGSAANVGAPRLYEVARRLEAEAGAKDLDKAKTSLAELRAALEETVAALHAKRPPDPPAS